MTAPTRARSNCDRNVRKTNAAVKDRAGNPQYSLTVDACTPYAVHARRGEANHEARRRRDRVVVDCCRRMLVGGWRADRWARRWARRRAGRRTQLRHELLPRHDRAAAVVRPDGD